MALSMRIWGNGLLKSELDCIACEYNPLLFCNLHDYCVLNTLWMHGIQLAGKLYRRMGVCNTPLQMAQSQSRKNHFGCRKYYIGRRKNYIRHNPNYIRPFFCSCKRLKNKLLYRMVDMRLSLWKSEPCVNLGRCCSFICTFRHTPHTIRQSGACLRRC